jgi:hypothetical protein
MLRFNADGVDLGRPSVGGRGLYVCRDARCVEKGLIRADVRKRLGGLGLAGVSESSVVGETAEIRLDGLHLGRVICDEGHGGCFFG